MPKEYQVKPGDCISSIAEREGLFWETLWNAPVNSDLKNKRKDPNLLLPGDIVVIPDKKQHQESSVTEQRHRFKRKGVPAVFRVVVERDDQPIRNTEYRLTIDNKLFQGTTDEKGLVEQSISPVAKMAVLEVDDLVYEMTLGGLDPLEEITGLQGRLQNLGFYEGAIDGDMGEDTRAALMEFQQMRGLETTGELDDDTESVLFSRQDEDHDAEPDDEPAEEPASVEDGGEPEDQEGESDGEEDFEGEMDDDDSHSDETPEFDIPEEEEDD